jgi:catechol 2,3-dioxygenase-like lactoylglutathione lyase family enzyme
MANPFVHVELTTQDPDKAKSFYGELFDWKLEDVEIGPGFTYTMVRVGEGTGGGIMKTPAPGIPTALAALRAGRGRDSGHRQGEIAWCHRGEGRHGSAERGLFLGHYRSDRRGDRALATEDEVTQDAGPSLPVHEAAKVIPPLCRKIPLKFRATGSKNPSGRSACRAARSCRRT